MGKIFAAELLSWPGLMALWLPPQLFQLVSPVSKLALVMRLLVQTAPLGVGVKVGVKVGVAVGVRVGVAVGVGVGGVLWVKTNSSTCA